MNNISFKVDDIKSVNIFPVISSQKYVNMDRNTANLNMAVDTAVNKYNKGIVEQLNNGDEKTYTNKIGTFTKGLVHDDNGIVDKASYDTLFKAITFKTPSLFEEIKLGGHHKLTNPQGGLSYNLEGLDTCGIYIKPSPKVSSDEAMGELIENYWMSVCRDVNFIDYDINPDTIAASLDLTNRRVFTGPKIDNKVTTKTLFKGISGLIGPYISQFLYLQVPFGAVQINQQMKTYNPNINFMTSFDIWLNIQNGNLPTEIASFDPVLRYIRNGRDLAQWVHNDILYQAYFNAMLILMRTPSEESQYGGIGCPFNPTNPYTNSTTQFGFATFGAPHISSLMAEVAQKAMKITWNKKWYVNKRLRPEAMGGLLHSNYIGETDYPISDDYKNSTVLSYIYDKYGSYLLPQAFPEGSPTHPSYPAGHATVAGSCVTILKAFFDENFVISSPVIPSSDGLTLEPYVGSQLTVLNELHKIADNVGIGRNHAGVHYRSDSINSILLGEQYAISVLVDHIKLYNEDFSGWKFTKFDGTTVIINKSGTNII